MRNGWSLKELDRQLNSALYERLSLSRDKEGVMVLAREGQAIEKPTDAIKDLDLVFYNRILRCFVLFDLKLGKLTHQDIGQMRMHVNYYDRTERLDGESKTIGILLCQEKNDAVVELTLPEDNDQIFASQYLTVPPSKEELKRLMSEA